MIEQVRIGGSARGLSLQMSRQPRDRRSHAEASFGFRQIDLIMGIRRTGEVGTFEEFEVRGWTGRPVSASASSHRRIATYHRMPMSQTTLGKSVSLLNAAG